MKIINKGNNKAEILIYEEIGDGWLGGISAKQFATDLAALGKLEEINVRINSDGGSVFDGVTIYNTLRRNGALIAIDIDGLAASISSIIAMAGDKGQIRMAQNATFMIHDPWAITAGSADDLRTQADLLDQLREQLVNTYDTVTDIGKDKISELMKAETWMTAEEALGYGFVDSITDEMRMAANWSLLDKYKNTPQALLKANNVVQKNEQPSNSDASVKIARMAARVAAFK